MASGKGQGLGAELAGVELGDARLERRARSMLSDLAQGPDKCFPKTWTDDSELEAAYRFLGNDSAKPVAIADTHAHKTADRALALRAPILVAHETTETRIPLYFEDKVRGGLGQKSSRQQGFDAHVSFAVGLDDLATPLGTLAMQSFVGTDEVGDTKAEKFWQENGGIYDNGMKRWREGILRSAELLYTLIDVQGHRPGCPLGPDPPLPAHTEGRRSQLSPLPSARWADGIAVGDRERIVGESPDPCSKRRSCARRGARMSDHGPNPIPTCKTTSACITRCRCSRLRPSSSWTRPIWSSTDPRTTTSRICAGPKTF